MGGMPHDLLAPTWFREAQTRVAPFAARTPLVRFPAPAGAPGELWLKDEGSQPIGSFKLRGAANKILALPEAERRRGVITYSSGNHAQGVAYAARRLGIPAVVVMPSSTSSIKRSATEALGATIVTVGPASAERREKAEQLAAGHGYAVVPPYDDPWIIAGQGTCGLEILEDAPDVDLVLAPVSGGGLLSGIAAAIKHQRPEIRVVGVEPELAGDAHESFMSGQLQTWAAELTTRTIADGLRTQSLGELNWAHIHAFCDSIVTVTEEEIGASVRAIYRGCPPRAGSGERGLVAEPSGAVAAAALLFHAPELLPYRRAVAVLSGRNIEPALLGALL